MCYHAYIIPSHVSVKDVISFAYEASNSILPSATYSTDEDDDGDDDDVIDTSDIPLKEH